MRHHDGVIVNDKRLLRRMVARHGADAVFDLIALKRADNLSLQKNYRARASELDAIEGALRALLDEPPCFSVRDLAIDGNTLIAMGAQRGPMIGHILRTLHEEVMEERLQNKKEDLCAFAAVMLEECKKIIDKGDFHHVSFVHDRQGRNDCI